LSGRRSRPAFCSLFAAVCPSAARAQNVRFTVTSAVIDGPDGACGGPCSLDATGGLNTATIGATVGPIPARSDTAWEVHVQGDMEGTLRLGDRLRVRYGLRAEYTGGTFYSPEFELSATVAPAGGPPETQAGSAANLPIQMPSGTLVTGAFLTSPFTVIGSGDSWLFDLHLTWGAAPAGSTLTFAIVPELTNVSYVRGCYGDLDGDGAVRVQDLLFFLQAFSTGERSADVNGDGRVNVNDFLTFLSDYAAGCP
jgi:hypothetical protein